MNKKKVYTVIIILLGLIALSLQVKAQDEKIQTKPIYLVIKDTDFKGRVEERKKEKHFPGRAGYTNMSNGIVLPKGQYRLRLRHIYAHKYNLYQGNDKKTGNYNGKYAQVNHISNLLFRAGLFENFEARIAAPFIYRKM
ncbi:MAG: hypothetical protein ACOCUL_01175 [Bacteroidota bacterium]